MATLRQKRLAKEIVKSVTSKKKVTAGQLLENVGYSKNTAKANPSGIIEADGVQEELKQMGFTSMNAKRVVSKIMLNEAVDPHTRLKAADMTFKVFGDYVTEDKPSGTTINNLTQINIHHASDPGHLPNDQATPSMDGVTES